MKNKNRAVQVALALVGLLVAGSLLVGCGSPRPYSPSYPGTPAPSPRTAIYVPETGAAGGLFQTARSHFINGDYAQTELLLERALRVEPRNAHYWYALAETKYQQKRYSQAINLCRKSQSLAGRNDQLLHLNNRLMDKARQNLGQ